MSSCRVTLWTSYCDQVRDWAIAKNIPETHGGQSQLSIAVNYILMEYFNSPQTTGALSSPQSPEYTAPCDLGLEEDINPLDYLSQVAASL